MVQLIKGFKDILPGEIEKWQAIEKTAEQLFEDFGYRQIRVPIMEKTELFARSIGEDTDIVEKEMYTFADRGKNLLTLRPEATASIVRAYIQHKMYASDPVRKFYTIGPMFRRERPQKGRYRQFYQIDAEVFGVTSPYIDAQLIVMLSTLLARLEVSDVTAHVNSLGCPACRPGYKALLGELLASREADLCADCRRRSTSNPLRVLDCKVPACREAMADAPSLLAHLCTDCRSHFDTVQSMLTDMAVPYVTDERLVRGLDYYTRTAFELQTGALGAQSAVAGGGRYDGLVKTLGGPDIPAIGFAVGFDRLAEIAFPDREPADQEPLVYIAALGEKSVAAAFGWSTRLSTAGVHSEVDFSNKSLKSQMKRANRVKAGHVLIVGDNELDNGSAILRNMATREQVEIPVDTLVDSICRFFEKV